MPQMTDELELQTAVEHHRAGRRREAETIYRELIQRRPESPELHYNLANLLKSDARLDEAIEGFEAAIALRPHYPDALNNLALVLLQQGKCDEAITCCRRAIAIAPDHLAACNNLGNALRRMGRLDEAIECYQHALSHPPRQAATLNNLGSAMKDAGQLPSALRCFHEALLLEPARAETHNHLGVVLKMIDLLDDALLFFQRALQIQPDYPEALNNLGLLFKDMARLDEAIACFERALATKPPRADVHSNLLYTLLFHPTRNVQLVHELQRWNSLHARFLQATAGAHHTDKTSGRRLKIGYVSPDFRHHCAASFLLPLLASHDHEKFEIHCFAGVIRPDDMTERFMKLADRWHSTVGWSDEEMAWRICEHRIDILVDCTLHLAGNRLLVFARKPAPLQVSWLGYPGSTGLSAIDYRITDPHLEPVDARACAEEPYRLPETFWCYDPLEGPGFRVQGSGKEGKDATSSATEASAGATEVNDLPGETNGFVTFGCLNNFCKINEPLLRMWSSVLRRVPKSRLILLAPSGSPRRWVLEVLATEQIECSRLQFELSRSRSEYLRLYHQIDIALDSFPYNGHTTSLDALWMGVPVVTLAGSSAVSRAGVCHLNNLELSEFIANNAEEFVEIGASLAEDLARLARLRKTLRPRMERSPLMDATRFARNMENAYLELWRRTAEATNAV
jgi:predicted O-linked N-acetylglucosamine transferase (SPINDLY family)